MRHPPYEILIATVDPASLRVETCQLVRPDDTAPVPTPNYADVPSILNQWEPFHIARLKDDKGVKFYFKRALAAQFTGSLV